MKRHHFGCTTLLLFWLGTVVSQAQIVTYECETFPEKVGWEHVYFSQINRYIDDGIFVQFIDGEGVVDAYRRPIAEFAGSGVFFVEWRAESDAPKSILDFSGTPAALVLGGQSAAFYHFTMTDSKVQISPGFSLPTVFADIVPGVPHTYRVELCNVPLCPENRYAWYIDGQMGDSGVADGPYPGESSVVLFATRRQGFDSTTRWDYVRYGVIPQEATGDFDSNEAIELFDYYFVHECLTNDRIGIHGGPDNDSGPGCRF
ncbi:MAG: hypothetical protein AABZ47_04375, partial [Planctomycetota bacterium]